MDKQTLIAIGREAIDISFRGHYTSENGIHVNIGKEVMESIRESKLYSPKATSILDNEMEIVEEPFETSIEVTAETTLEACQRLVLDGHNVACLNFASAKFPGGGFLNGARAQEESLARSSALYPTIAQMKDMYDYNRKKWGFYSDYMVYSPDVPVFRKDSGELIDTPYFVSMITSPAVNAGIVMKSDPSQRNAITTKMRMRIRKILAVARENGEQVLVLGAYGCGVFGNSPEEVARLFKEALEDTRYKGAFEKIVFAIYEPAHVKNRPAFDKTFQ